jgi:hypothetical protein
LKIENYLRFEFCYLVFYFEVPCVSSIEFSILSCPLPAPFAMTLSVIPASLFSVPPAGLISHRYKGRFARAAADLSIPLKR